MGGGGGGSMRGERVRRRTPLDWDGGGGETMKVLRVEWVRRWTRTSMGTLKCRIVEDYEGTV